jgi:hypothetical protein
MNSAQFQNLADSLFPVYLKIKRIFNWDSAHRYRILFWIFETHTRRVYAMYIFFLDVCYLHLGFFYCEQKKVWYSLVGLGV